MKQVKFLLLAAFVAMFTGCQNEEIMEQDSEKDESVPTGDTRIHHRRRGDAGNLSPLFRRKG